MATATHSFYPQNPSKTLYQEHIELQERNKPQPLPLDDAPDAVSYWAYATAAGLVGLLAFPLILFPRFILFLAGGLDGGGGNDEVRAYERLTALEGFLCMQAGILLLALACLILLLTAPPPPHIDTPATYVPSDFPRPKSRITQFYAQRPTAVSLLTPFFFVSSFASWCSQLGSISFLFSAITGTIGLWGAWVSLFGTDAGHRSKKTGADKRTASFPFKNEASAQEQKKKWYEEQKTK